MQISEWRIRMKIGAVIVTFNRLELLKICLSKYMEQTRMPDYILVVDNASTDGTKEYLDEWKEKNQEKVDIVLIHKPSNTGGSGGFYTGMKEAMKLSVDWIWVSDDDAMPESDVFEKLENYIKNSNENLAAVCSSVINKGEVDTTHRARRKKKIFRYKFTEVPASEYAEKDCMEIDTFTYVGSMMNAKKIEKCGYVQEGFFIWQDDTEHSWRLSETGKIVCLSNAKIHHDVPPIRYSEVSWKKYYGYRNELIMIKEHEGKRYYMAKKLILTIKGLLDKNKDHLRIVKAAIKDADNNILGIHDVYKPGWTSDYQK